MSELEVPSQGPATIIATVSVLCALIILLIISGILYKVSLLSVCLTDEVLGLSRHNRRLLLGLKCHHLGYCNTVLREIFFSHFQVGFFKSKKEAGEDSCALSAQEGEGTSPPADQSPDTPQPKVNGDAS